jgi:DnaK suppressor protein
VAKAPVKKAAKPAPKAAVKPLAKPIAKAAAKKAVKAPAKPVAKSVPKTPVKAAAKASKPVAKPVKAAAKPVAKKAVKASVKPVLKTLPKAPAKPAPKPAAKPTAKAPVKPVKAAEVISKPTAKSVPKVKATEPMTVTATKPVPAAAAPVPAAVPQKTGRPSSRLAQLTVPSMAQSVASTAAKASYSQVVTAPVIVPVLPSSIKKDPKLANNWKTKPANELTDAELMAMPDSEYMNEAQMGAFRHRLSVLKRDILNSAGETTEHLREDTSVVPDPADRATIEEEHALELRTRDRERKLLKKIEQSISRIDSGDYGYCDETGEPIGVGRLLARPTASLSLEAQQRRELKQKMFGD